MSQTHPPKPVEVGTRKYVIHFADGRQITCIDLQKDPPEQVEAGIRAMFWRYTITKIER